MDSVDVVQKKDESVLHLINVEDEGNTVCGESYTEDEVVSKDIDEAGVWCLDCLNMNLEELEEG